MHRVLETLTQVLRLTRVTTASAVISNSWFVVLWTRANPNEYLHGALREWPLWVVLTAAAGNAVGLFGFGMCLNDWLDQRRDRASRPHRPLAAGDVRPELVISLMVWFVLMAVVGATAFNVRAVLVTVLLVGLILVFNGMARFVPAFGLVSYGLIYSGAMLVPNTQLNFLIPVWVVLTLMTFLTGAAHALGRRIPPISPRAWAFAVLGWASSSAVLLTFAWSRNRDAGGVWPDWVDARAALGAAAVLAVLVVVCWRKLRLLGRGPRIAEKFTRYGTIAMSFSTPAWMYGAGFGREALFLLTLAVVGYLSMTILRELFALVEHPLGYRR